REDDAIDALDPALGPRVHVGDDHRRALDGAELGVRRQDRPLREEARVEGGDGGDADVLTDVEERRDDLDPLALIQEELGGRERLLGMDVVDDDDVRADPGGVCQHVPIRYDVFAVGTGEGRDVGMRPGGDDDRVRALRQHSRGSTHVRMAPSGPSRVFRGRSGSARRARVVPTTSIWPAAACWSAWIGSTIRLACRIGREGAAFLIAAARGTYTAVGKLMFGTAAACKAYVWAPPPMIDRKSMSPDAARRRAISAMS